MPVLAKKLPTKEVEIRIGGTRPHLFLVPKDKAAGLLQVLKEFEVSERQNDSVGAEEVFPDLADERKRPAAMLRGARQKEGLSQVDLAKKLKISQSDLSKMEHGKRPIGKQMARRLAAALKIDYRVFL